MTAEVYTVGIAELTCSRLFHCRNWRLFRWRKSSSESSTRATPTLFWRSVLQICGLPLLSIRPHVYCLLLLCVFLSLCITVYSSMDELHIGAIASYPVLAASACTKLVHWLSGDKVFLLASVLVIINHSLLALPKEPTCVNLCLFALRPTPCSRSKMGVFGATNRHSYTTENWGGSIHAQVGQGWLSHPIHGATICTLTEYHPIFFALSPSLYPSSLPHFLSLSPSLYSPTPLSLLSFRQRGSSLGLSGTSTSGWEKRPHRYGCITSPWDWFQAILDQHSVSLK